MKKTKIIDKIEKLAVVLFRNDLISFNQMKYIFDEDKVELRKT